jgi:hypothetical protein
MTQRPVCSSTAVREMRPDVGRNRGDSNGLD